jgi:hypothetical protein
LTQVLVLGVRFAHGAGASPTWLEVGDTLFGIPTRGRSGSEVLSGGPMVLLAFDSHCSPSLAVASAWAAWIRESGLGWHVVAVSSEPLEVAQAFARQQGWDVEVAVVEVGPLTKRTPWVFVLNAEGVLVAQGHGSRISQLTAGLSTSSTMSAGR